MDNWTCKMVMFDATVYGKRALIRCLQEAAEGQNDCIEEPTFGVVCVWVYSRYNNYCFISTYLTHSTIMAKGGLSFLLTKKERAQPANQALCTEMWFVCVEKESLLGNRFLDMMVGAHFFVLLHAVKCEKQVLGARKKGEKSAFFIVGGQAAKSVLTGVAIKKAGAGVIMA